jgi:hypothetical protein
VEERGVAWDKWVFAITRHQTRSVVIVLGVGVFVLKEIIT